MRPAHQLIAVVLAGLLPGDARACAACFSQADSPLADGMNAGIFTLLAVVTMVLLAIGAFCLHLARRAAAAEVLAAASASPGMTMPTSELETPGLK